MGPEQTAGPSEAAVQQIKQDARLRTIPVVVLTTSANPHDVELCYRYGANSYIVKPVDFERLRRSLELLTAYWFDVVTLLEGKSSWHIRDL